jgi:hypothetical protein
MAHPARNRDYAIDTKAFLSSLRARPSGLTFPRIGRVSPRSPIGSGERHLWTYDRRRDVHPSWARPSQRSVLRRTRPPSLPLLAYSDDYVGQLDEVAIYYSVLSASLVAARFDAASYREYPELRGE